MRQRPYLKLDDFQIPLSVEYLGLLDTVAANRHCRHRAGSERPYELGRRQSAVARWQAGRNGACTCSPAMNSACVFRWSRSVARAVVTPVNSVEVIYPGVHSDLGGGYPPGDQGKGTGENDGLLLSQIALNDLYADAFARTAPLKSRKSRYQSGCRHELWRAMEFDVVKGFDIAQPLVTRFNAWRQDNSPDLPLSSQPLPD